MLILAIETSCDETAVAVWDSEARGRELAGESIAQEKILLIDQISSQAELHQPFGGVVPELAARQHVINLPILVRQSLHGLGIGLSDLGAIAVTRGPGLKGCLLVGLCYAKGAALAAKVPLLAVNHIEGHIFAGNLAPRGERPELPMLSLVVSGGHTMLVLTEEFRSYSVVAATRDDAAGEAFDKAAMMLGLPYPGGPALSKAATAGNADRFRFPVGMANSPEHFSFSGLKTAMLRQIAELGSAVGDPQVKADLAASLEAAIVRSLVEKSIAACKSYRPRSFLLTGGVAANTRLRTELAAQLGPMGIAFTVPERRWCTDNAAMIAALADEIIRRDPAPYRGWRKSGAAGGLGPEANFSIGPLARWPLGSAPAAAKQ